MRFQFGDCTVDDGSRLLLRAGTGVPLSPKAFGLLITLIRERPRALSKSDLHARLWPKTFVTDASLAMLVAEVRAALGETAREPRCVRTVHRHGYAFQATASEISQVPLAPGAAAAASDATLGYWLITSARQIPLVAGENMVGRDPKAHVWLESPSVSRWHARISVEGGCVTVEDLGSKNGTRVGDARITTVTSLNDADELRFGSVRVSFKAWAADPTRSEAGSP